MDVLEIIQIGSILIFGSIIQSSAGFGFGLFALPIMLYLGFGLPETVIIMVIGSAVQKITAISVMWKSADWKGHAPYMGVGLLALPLGVLCMYHVSFMDQDTVKQVMGGIIMLMLLLQWKGIIKAKEHVSAIWGYIAGTLSGFLNGFANIGGPPLVLWILSHRWPNEKMRVTPIAFSMIFVPFQIFWMIERFGARMWDPLIKAALLTPAVLLGSWIGLKIGGKISRAHLTIYMRVLLAFIAIAAFIKL